MMNSEAHHPIQVVARRTGLTVDTLRAWEKRYAAVSPRRSGNGRRVYTDSDIERLLLLRRATDNGRRIGQIAELDLESLRALVEEDANANVTAPPPRRRKSRANGEIDAGEHLVSCLEAVESLDAVTLERALARAQLDLPTRRLVVDVISPLLDEIGERWHAGELRVANEHMASAGVRALLQALAYNQPPADEAPSVVVTTPSGQRHDLGALMAAVMATTAGWRATFLGADLPAEEIAAAVEQTGSRAVILSVIYPADDPRVALELGRTRRLVDPNVPMIVGGRAVGGYERVLAEAQARVISTLDEIPDILHEIRAPQA